MTDSHGLLFFRYLLVMQEMINKRQKGRCPRFSHKGTTISLLSTLSARTITKPTTEGGVSSLPCRSAYPLDIRSMENAISITTVRSQNGRRRLLHLLANPLNCALFQPRHLRLRDTDLLGDLHLCLPFIKTHTENGLFARAQISHRFL